MQRPISHQLELEDLTQDLEFREFWNEVLKGIRRFGLNEAMLSKMHRPKPRVGNINDINSQAALDMHRLEGSLETWETLLYLTSDPVKQDEEADEETASI